jgi:putative DNA primase/helicase
MYSRDRYFTITGQRVPGTPETIEDRAAALQALYDRMFANPDSPRKTMDSSTRFERLWAGDTSDYGGDESRADLALCCVLARQTGNDPARIDALFRQSGLYRDKWERPDYRDRTIALALAPPDPAPDSLKLTDLGNAERLVKQHGGELRYCPELRTWLAWDGVRWNLDAVGCAVEYAKLTVRGIYREAAQAANPGLREAIKDWARRSEAAGRLFAMVKLAESDQRLRVSPAELDRDTYLLNCSNGVVDLRTGELHPHDPSYLLTRLCPVEYRAEARAPRWERFLAEVFAPHPDLVPFLQRAAGYSLTGETCEECLFLLHGTGRNGKGVFLRTLMETLGDYAVTADFSTFTSQNDRGGPRDDVANMRGRHLVSAQEGREGAALAESLIKWLTGGDLVRARRLYENSYEFQPSHKIWLATNHKPAVRGADPAIWSRIKLVPFDVSFEGREDRGLKSAMKAELPGVLAWAVEGCLRWQEDGLCFPDTVRDATARWRGENDQLGQFLEDCCLLGEFATIKVRKLYAAHRRWAEEAGEEPLASRAFGERMRARGFEKKHRIDGDWYLGVGMTNEVS